MGMKRGSLSARTIIIIITIIIAFVIILFLYWQFNWTGEVDKEACHESVVLKATIPLILERKSVELPLRCRTEKICITSSLLGKCTYTNNQGKEQDIFAGEKFEKKVVKTDEDIKKVIAQALYDCWWMMGEGKVDIFSREFTIKKYASTCAICSRIAFDKNLQEKYPNGLSGFSKYLDETKVSGKDYSYTEFLSAKSLSIPAVEEKDTFKLSEQQAIVFQEFDRTTLPEDLAGAGVGALSAGLVGYGTRSLQLSTIAFFGGNYVGRKGGALVGGLLGPTFMSSWSFSPFKAGTIETEYVESVDKTTYPGACFAQISEENYYGFNSEGLFMWGDSRNVFSYTKESAKKYVVNLDTNEKGDARKDSDKVWLKQVLSELIVSCYNLKNLQCNAFESYA